MPSQKLKRICLGTISILMLTTLLWLVRYLCVCSNFYKEKVGLSMVLTDVSPWRSVIAAIGITFVLILGLYLMAKIIIEIFK